MVVLFYSVEKEMSKMPSCKSNANMTWSAADMFAVCFSCAKKSSYFSSVSKVYGTVLMAVPFFVLSVIICLIGIICNIGIILGLLIALIIIDILAKRCHDNKLKIPYAVGA